MKEKKKRTILVIGAIIILFVLAGIGVYLYPNFGALSVKWSPFHDFSYTVYKDHVVLEKYNGNKEEVTLPDTLWGKPVTVIGGCCFEQNATIQKVILSKYLNKIDNVAFVQCTNLKEVQGGKDIYSIGSGAFLGCKNLSNIGDLGQGVKEIGNGAFSGCVSLIYFPFTENLKRIGGTAFWGTGIEKVDIVKGIEYLGEQVFKDTPWLEQQTEDFVVYNDILIWYQGKDKTVKIPEGIRGIAVSFCDSEGIEEIYIPSSAEYLIYGSLLSCTGIQVYIPKEVEKIGYEIPYDEPERISTLGGAGTDSGNIIVTTAGSPAEAYAKEFGYECEIVEGW